MTSFFPVFYKFITRSATQLVQLTSLSFTHYSTGYEEELIRQKEDARVCWLGANQGNFRIVNFLAPTTLILTSPFSLILSLSHLSLVFHPSSFIVLFLTDLSFILLFLHHLSFIVQHLSFQASKLIYAHNNSGL